MTSGGKPVRAAVAAVIRRADGRFLAVRRPPDDDRLPDVWGLPAVRLAADESVEEGARRVGVEKLGVELAPIERLGTRSADRGEYELVLTDVAARIVSGEPDVRAARTTATRYTAQVWAEDPGLLREAARNGSLCCQILLEAEGLPY